MASSSSSESNDILESKTLKFDSETADFDFENVNYFIYILFIKKKKKKKFFFFN
jgi:hypothetical protein